MTTRPIAAAIGGALAGIVAIAITYSFLLADGSILGGGAPTLAPTTEPSVVAHEAKLGPRLTLKDRVFNLVSPTSAPVYAKIQTVIEFETTDARWAEVFDGCDGQGLVRDLVPQRAVSAAPGRLHRAMAPSTVEDVSPCSALELELLGEFETEIGSGVQLIEDAVTTIVSSKRPEDVATAAGKEALRREIRDAVEEIVDHPPVSRILFVNFITQ